jgi:hypothetical protein
MPNGENLAALQDAGFIIKKPMPSEYQEVFENLTPAELELLIGIKRKFDEASLSTAEHVGHFTSYFVPF